MRIFVARHGQTQWNAEKRVCGLTDLPLTEQGLQQAEALADALAEQPIHLIISSPMLRARQTANAVARKRNLPVMTDDRLTEQNYGIFEGVNRKDPGFLANKRQFAYRYPGGESMMDVAYRVYGLLNELKEKYPEKNILLVCHGGICRIVRTYFEDMTNEEFFNYSEKNATAREYQL